MDTKEIRTTMGIIGNVMSLIISLSQMPKFIQVYKEKEVPDEEDLNQHRHVVMVAKCSLWVLYGLPFVQSDSILVTTSNSLGLIIEVIYLIVFIIYCEDEDPRRDNTSLCLLFEGCFVAYIWYIVLLYEPFLARRKFIGVLCNIVTIIIQFCLAVDTMDKKESVRYMPFWLTFVSFINAGIWTAYSLIYKFDIYILITNGLGTLACAYLLVVHACCSLIKFLKLYLKATRV